MQIDGTFFLSFVTALFSRLWQEIAREKDKGWEHSLTIRSVALKPESGLKGISWNLFLSPRVLALCQIPGPKKLAVFPCFPRRGHPRLLCTMVMVSYFRFFVLLFALCLLK